MKNSFLLTLVLVGSIVSSCAAQEFERLNDAGDDSGFEDEAPMQLGYMVLGNETVEVEYYIDGEEAVIDAHSRVPLSAISPDLESLGLVGIKGTKLWPDGVVPYRIYIEDSETDRAYVAEAMSNAVNQFARAGIKLQPRASEAHFLDIRIVRPNSPEGKKLDARNFFGMANGAGFLNKGKGLATKMNNHSGNIVWVVDGPNVPFYRTPKGGFAKFADGWKRGSTYLLLHEIGHALGAMHEQAHPEARSFLKTNKTLRGQFEKYPKTEAFQSFDYKSVMLYCDSFILKSTNSNEPICELHTWPTTLSEGDVVGLANMYSKSIATDIAVAPTDNSERVAPEAANTSQVSTGKNRGSVSKKKVKMRRVGGDERPKTAKKNNKKNKNNKSKK